MNTKIGFIGCGNMGEALLKGLFDKRIIGKNRILASDTSLARRNYIQRRYKIKVLSSNRAVVKDSNIIIFAIKPQNIDDVLRDIRSEITAKKLLISIAAGITIRHIQKMLPKCRIIRVMPNTPALIGLGITAICKSKTASQKDYNSAEKIFNAVGEVIWVNENLMDAVTAASGSGPAYLFLFIDSMIKASVSLGLDTKTAEWLILNTVLGSATLAFGSGNNMDELIKKVASKGGTTEAALKVFNKRKFQGIIKEAIKAASKRSKELTK